MFTTKKKIDNDERNIILKNFHFRKDHPMTNVPNLGADSLLFALASVDVASHVAPLIALASREFGVGVVAIARNVGGGVSACLNNLVKLGFSLKYKPSRSRAYS